MLWAELLRKYTLLERNGMEDVVPSKGRQERSWNRAEGIVRLTAI